MNGSSFGAEGDSGQQPYRQPREAASPPDSTINRQALEQALQETLSAASSGAPIDPAEMEAIRRAAARHRAEAITLDIAADLIQAVLATHFRSLQAGDSFWQTIARDIARTLLDDPQAEQRLNTLWGRLRRETP